MPTAVRIQFGGEELVLNADRTLWWPSQKILFAADLHAGKTMHMRHYGLAIPGGVMEADLARLTTGAEEAGATRLIFLGDLFHSEHNAEWEAFADWSRAQSYSVELVRGNHDRFLTDEQLAAANLTVYREPYQLGPFDLRHHPEESPSASVLAGHLHPVIRLQGIGRDRLRLPCFVRQDRQLILPAFGSFTGGLDITRSAGDIYACADDRSAIIPVLS